MGFFDIVNRSSRGLGKLVGKIAVSLNWFEARILSFVHKLLPGKQDNEFRSRMAAELNEVLGRMEQSNAREVEEQFKKIMGTITALQRELLDLKRQNSLTEKNIHRTVDSMQDSDGLSAEDRSIFATILKENIMLQKPWQTSVRGTDSANIY